MFLLQEVAHRQSKALVDFIEGREWSGEIHLGQFKVWVHILIRTASCFYGLPSTRTLNLFSFQEIFACFYVFLLIGAGGDPPGMAQGYHVGLNGTTLPLARGIKAEKVQVR